MGRLKDGRAVFAIGPLPGELARIGLRKQKKTYAEAVLRNIIEPSPKRVQSIDDHTLSTAPWQGVLYAYQLELKRDMLRQAFSQAHLDVPEVTFVASDQQLHYRNRLDFTVAHIDGQLELAFHRRGSWDTLIKIVGSNLGSRHMNIAANDLVAQLRSLHLDVSPALITVRHARTTGDLLTILTTTAEAEWSRIKMDRLDNFLVTRPLPGSGAPGDIVFQAGDSYITERVSDIDIAYPYNGFFQTNTTVFNLALRRIAQEAHGHRRVIELYSGVGAIGLPLAAAGSIVHGVEVIPEAVEFAERNARTNGITTYTAEAVAAEKMDGSLLASADCVIVDPPRAGLHPRVTDWLLASQPNTIIYLSCNPVTQARDIARLSQSYDLSAVTGYDFYPGTLHLESLAILKKS